MKVAVYHPFHDLPDNYSLSHIVKEQLLMLTEHKVETHFVTSNDFKGEVPYGVRCHAVLSFNNAKEIYKQAEPLLRKVSCVLTHDIVYLDSYKDHETALRRISKKHKLLRWLHWSHSAPNPSSSHKPFHNSIYIGMNYTDLPRLAQHYNVAESVCRVVYNSVSPDLFFDWHPFTHHLVKKHNLLDCDVLITYPLDTGRFASKGGYKIIKLVEYIRKLKKNAKVVFVNAAANTKERTAIVKGLSNEYTIFTSLEDKQYNVVVPHRVVRELMQISNVFPLLSDSEGCSLTMLEAALTKNVVVLNEDFPAMREFGEIDHTYYMKVSSTRCQTKYNPDENSYYTDWANIIIGEVEGNRVLKFNRKILRRFNRDWIFKNQLEPLLS